MRLDKDIHSKLVNPQHSSTLEKNVKNVMLALNSGAPYDKVINMIDSIRVWISLLIYYIHNKIYMQFLGAPFKRKSLASLDP